MKYDEYHLRMYPVWKHVNTGGIYHVLGLALCSTNGERDKKETSVIYFSISKQRLWYREINEFLSGRFEPVIPDDKEIT